MNPAGQVFCDGCGLRLGAAPTPRVPHVATPAHLTEKVLRNRRQLEGERKQVTVLFADVAHSMRLAEAVDAEEWHRILDRYFQILAAGIHRFEGTINQFTGDGIMALFGAPVAHEDHAQRACHAALHLREALRPYATALAARGLEFAVRMGLNSGDVVLGRIGDDLRVEYTAVGNTVGLAARVQQVAAPGTAYVTEHTARLVDGFFVLDDRGTPAMKGVTVPLRAYELRSVGPLRTRLDASRAHGFSPLVGREEELALLAAILARTATNGGQVVGVVGDPGVGKSRVCLEFVERCRGAGVAVHEAHCPSHGAGVPLLSIRELVRSCLGLGKDEPTAGAALADRLSTLGLSDTLALVLELLGLPGADTGLAAAGRDGLADVVRRLLRAQTAAGQVVLLIDDAHWIDPASDALLHAVTDVVHATPMLLLANFRPEYRASWMGGAHYHQLALAPLSESASEALLSDLLGADGSVSVLFDPIRERTAGNPFFIEEVVRALAAAGSLAGPPGAYRLAARPETLTIPPTVQSLLAARVDRLGEQPKRVLQAAAVIGKEFDVPLLREIAGLDPAVLGTTLSALQDAEFIRETRSAPDTQYTFRHPLTQEVAYLSQLADGRARLHIGVATALQKLRAERLGEHAGLIAHHWEIAGMRWEAARWRRRAALQVASIQVRGAGRGREPRRS